MPTNYKDCETLRKTPIYIHQASSNRLYLALFLISAAVVIAVISITDNIAIGAGILGTVVSIILIKQPEIALAVLFNGIIIYFYLLYKLGLETNRITTALFYLVLVMTAIIGSAIIITRRRQKFRLDPIDILFTCFFVYIFLSYFFLSTKHEVAHIKICYAPLMVVGPYFAAALLSSEKAIYNFFRYCVILAAVLIIPSFYELLCNPALENSARFSAYELNSLDNPILFGLTFGTLLIIAGTWILEKNGFKSKLLMLIVPSTYLLLRAGSRGALLSFVITMLFGIILAEVKFKTKVFSLIAGVLLFMIAYHFIPETTLNFYKGTLDYQDLPESSVSQRVIMWQQALTDFTNSPLIGVGVGNSVWSGGYPHNIFLEVGAELGIVGLTMLLAIYYLSIKSAINFIRRTTGSELKVCMKAALLLFIYSSADALFSGYITNQNRLFISVALISTIVRIKSKSANTFTVKSSAFMPLKKVLSCE